MAKWKKVSLKKRIRSGKTTYLPRWWDGAQSRYGRVFHSKAEAEKYRGRYEAFINGDGDDPDAVREANAPEDLITPRKPFTESIDSWLKSHNSRAKTKIIYRSAISRFASIMDIKYIEDVTTMDVVKYLVKLRAGDTPKSEATIAAYLKMLAAFFRSERPDDCPITDKLVKDWKPYATFKRGKRRYFAAAEFDQLMDTCDHVEEDVGLRLGQRGSVWWRAFLTLLYRCGLRFNEAARLLWDCVDFDKGTIEIKDHEKIPGVLPWKPKSRNALRKVPMTPDLVDALVKLQADAPEGVPYVFVSLNRYRDVMRKKLGPEMDIITDIGNQLKRILKRAGLGKGMMHDLRRTCVTNWLIAGNSIPDVQLMAGHDTPALTLSIYNEIGSSDATERVRARMAESHRLAKKGRKKIAGTAAAKK